MLSNLKSRTGDEKGFTLIELLVVILIIAILAAVAIPTFLNQRGKAYDSNAQSMAKNAQTAEETFATNNNGTYTSTWANLVSIDPSLGDFGAGKSVAAASASGASTSGYTITVTAQSTGDVYTLSEANGVEQNTCSTGSGGGSPGACSGGSW
jgi:type IV pilus assembly protein PilA